SVTIEPRPFPVADWTVTLASANLGKIQRPEDPVCFVCFVYSMVSSSLLCPWFRVSAQVIIRMKGSRRSPARCGANRHAMENSVTFCELRRRLGGADAPHARGVSREGTRDRLRRRDADG